MNAIHDGVETLVDLELRSANNKFPLFNSAHEGYAIIKEEFEETFDELVNVRSHMGELWRRIKANEHKEADRAISLLYIDAVKTAEEAIQLAAMCKKFNISTNPEERNKYERKAIGFNHDPKHFRGSASDNGAII